MLIFDLIHAYQPYDPDALTFDWVRTNLEEVILPTSVAMRNHASTRRGIQIKGWTIDNWLRSDDQIKKLATESLENLRLSVIEKNIEVGISGYSHPILPLLHNDLLIAQIDLDYESVREHLGTPTWFWPPEGAISTSVLETVYAEYPDLIVVIPDRALRETNYSGVINIKHAENKFQKALVCNSLLKDLVMNAHDYKEKPGYLPENAEWERVRELHVSSDKFQHAIDSLGGDIHIIARDWENKGSREGLRSMEKGGMDLKSLLEIDAQFLTPSEADWKNAQVIDLEHIKNASWEVDAPHEDPFMYWWPDNQGAHWGTLNPEQRMWALKWQNFLNEFNDNFSEWSKKKGGIKNILADRKQREIIKSLMPALMSCIPWHFLSKQMWEPSPEFSKVAWEKIVVPRSERLKDMLKR